MKTLVVAALAALLCTAVTAARADEAKKPAPAAEPAAAKPEAGKPGTATAQGKAGAKVPEKKGDAAPRAEPKAAEKPCEPVKPCSID